MRECIKSNQNFIFKYPVVIQPAGYYLLGIQSYINYVLKFVSCIESKQQLLQIDYSHCVIYLL